MDTKQERALWRGLTNVWTVCYLSFLVANFFAQNAYGYLVGPLSTLYVGILGIYVGTKEFDRWHSDQSGVRKGERFVIAITAIIVGLFITSLLLGEDSYRVSTDIVATYIAVLSIFAITQKSKELHEEHVRDSAHAGTQPTRVASEEKSR